MDILYREFFASDEVGIRMNYAEYPTERIHDFRTHNHIVCEMFFLLDGDISYKIEGRSYELRRYDLVFVRPGKNHYLTFDEAKGELSVAEIERRLAEGTYPGGDFKW